MRGGDGDSFPTVLYRPHAHGPDILLLHSSLAIGFTFTRPIHCPLLSHYCSPATQRARAPQQGGTSAIFSPRHSPNTAKLAASTGATDESRLENNASVRQTVQALPAIFHTGPFATVT